LRRVAGYVDRILERAVAEFARDYPAGGSPAQVRGSARLVVSVAWPIRTRLFAAASDCRGSLRRPSLGRLECSFLSHLRQQRLQLISQPNNVLLVMTRPPSSWRVQAKYGGGCPVESLSDIAAEYEFGGAHRVVNRVNRSACDTPAVHVGERCPQVIDGLDSETQRRGFLRLPLGADREHKACDRHHQASRGQHKSDDDCYVGHGQVLPVARKILDPAPSPINRSFLRWLSRCHFFAIGPRRE